MLGAGEDLEAKVAVLERRLERFRAENRALETLIETKTRSLYLTQQELEGNKRYLENVLASMNSAIIIADPDGVITSVGGTTSNLTGWAGEDLQGRTVCSVLVLESPDCCRHTMSNLIRETVESELRTSDDRTVPVLVTTSTLNDDDGTVLGIVLTAADISERKQLEVELRHAQRLESIGELAAGVAHEINTPIQFVSDSVRFIGDALEDLVGLMDAHRPLRELASGMEGGAAVVSAIEEEETAIDIGFLREELPKAVTRTLDGVERVSSIVRALKQFAHPADDALAPADVNRIIETTLTVARNEYRYVAEVEFEPASDPEILCQPGDLGQVFLNLVVNAAHAIGQRFGGTGQLGRIVIRARPVDTGLEIRIADNGGGIPVAVRDRVFEPFFTTKEPGRGTGQGLALAHNMIVTKHGGRITFEVDEGEGTTFSVWLPREQFDESRRP